MNSNRIEDDARTHRSMEEMAKEAAELRHHFDAKFTESICDPRTQ